MMQGVSGSLEMFWTLPPMAKALPLGVRSGVVGFGGSWGFPREREPSWEVIWERSRGGLGLLLAVMVVAVERAGGLALGKGREEELTVHWGWALE